VTDTSVLGLSGEMAVFCRGLQSRICSAFEAFEPRARFEPKSWRRPDGHRLQGGGDMRVMRGDVFEKVGVNVSHVWGTFEPKFREQIPGAAESEGAFVACGISLVAHMRNPYVPAVHMNLRYLHTSRGWVGGGTDLSPTCPFEVDPAVVRAARERAGAACRPGAFRVY
jgi:coproporphyrinogen III oxidase